ncbi:MAG: DEAD/DEAH box helicase [Chloroflexi bacterium]|nr:DEAD/DEAH box helicase [Ardenticatenaceae bacterium]MBL1130974.1 DEAD/DEAH box helicase [Chloroflexota bacterium]NOG37073.1 DEAD/DEAH box helicase [Chloroflexota bacterium]GIK57051.1 MAG: ATP-dependent RNA helicase RhlE [Chloroflexota bacterium]
MSFDIFNLHPRIAAGIQTMGYDTPTPIQVQAIPPILQGKDILGLAQTGTGKTAAFVLPILQRLMQGTRGHVRALVVAPTRELAEQINDSFVQLGGQTKTRSTAVYGGVGVNPQIQRLKQGVEVVVACPGRLLDHINQKTIDLSRLEVLVLDEADRMCDMGFLPDIRKLLKHLPTQRQTLFFSATMPDDIRRLSHDILKNPVTVQVDLAKPAVTVSHALYPVPQHLKTGLLLALLRHMDTESVLIFTRTKHRARRVAEQINRAGHKAAALQGNMSQNRRQEAMDGFRSGQYKIMVATDIAARGIDVTQISHVINYDMPDTADAYTHRIGRTGRAAKTGDAFTFVTAEDTDMIRAIERVLGEKLERRTLPEFDYSAPAPSKDTEFARPPRQPRSPRPAQPIGSRPPRNRQKTRVESGARP